MEKELDIHSFFFEVYELRRSKNTKIGHCYNCKVGDKVLYFYKPTKEVVVSTVIQRQSPQHAVVENKYGKCAESCAILVSLEGCELTEYGTVKQIEK